MNIENEKSKKDRTEDTTWPNEEKECEVVDQTGLDFLELLTGPHSSLIV